MSEKKARRLTYTQKKRALSSIESKWVSYSGTLHVPHENEKDKMNLQREGAI